MRDEPKPGLVAERKARLLPSPMLVGAVVEVLGEKLTGYLVEIGDTRTIQSWARDGNIDLLPKRKLQAALAAIATLQTGLENDRIAPWFTFLQDGLDDRSPAALIRSATADTIEAIAGRVIGAARRELAP